MIGRNFEFPDEQKKMRERATRIAWASIMSLTIAAIVLAVTLGQSQAMKTAWISDILSIIPPIALLVGLKFELREPSKRFPFGYFRSISVAFLVTASVLTIIGAYLLFDSASKLLKQERPAIGTMDVFGHR